MSAESSPTWPPAGGVDPDVAVWREGPATVIGLHGEHDLSNQAALSTALTKICAVGGAGDVIIDLSQASFVDSATVAALLGGRQVVMDQGRRFSLRTPTLPVQRVLEICGLASFVEPETSGRGADARSDGHLPRTRTSDTRSDRSLRAP
jgi:anti-anti-sigma factor